MAELAKTVLPEPLWASRIPAWLARLSGNRTVLMLIGFAATLGFWYLAVEVLRLPRFRELPGPTVVIQEWTSRDPLYGISLFTAEYYKHIVASLLRVFAAFALSTLIGVPLGLLLGWSKSVREFVFPVFETLRPIPALAWVPLAIIMFKGTETPVIFLTFLASFYATTLNTMLGVQSIDPVFVRAAQCFGANNFQIFMHVIVPGSLKHIFNGLQLSIGVAWFSLVAAEMISGEYGLGYMINSGYTLTAYPTIVIGMITIGIIGFSTSALVAVIGRRLMAWRAVELADLQ